MDTNVNDGDEEEVCGISETEARQSTDIMYFARRRGSEPFFHKKSKSLLPPNIRAPGR